MTTHTARRLDKELDERDRRRKLLFSGICPHCRGAVMPNPDWDKRNDRFNWFTCSHCHTTTGVQKS